MSESEPEVAVVVATHNRAALLPRLVHALEKQDITVPFEVIVVDDASSDDTPATLEDLRARSSLRLRPIRLDENRGPATARNRAWRSTAAKLVAFTDDDCVPSPGWLRSLVDGLARHDIAQGMTLPDPDSAVTLGPFSHTISVTSENGRYETCNLGYRRDVLEREGGFDETFRHPMGEDIDLALRAKAHGATTTFQPEAVVYHDVSPSNLRSFLALRRKREGFALLCQRHPEMRSELTFGVFTHLNALLLAALVVAFIVLRGNRGVGVLLVAAAAKYAHQIVTITVPPARRWQWVGVVPLHLIADTYEMAVMARTSIEHGTRVL